MRILGQIGVCSKQIFTVYVNIHYSDLRYDSGNTNNPKESVNEVKELYQVRESSVLSTSII